MIKKLVFAIATAASLALVSSAQANVIIGLPADPNTGNCYPFGCSYDGTYQQVYTASAFSGPISISSLQFFNTMFNSNANAMNAGTWTISLSTTSADWNSLSGTFASNLGGDNTVVFSGDLFQPWAFGNTLNINLVSAFLYDPSLGNLLMNVSVSGASSAGGNIYFDTNGSNIDGNTIMGRVYDSDDGITVNSGYGLVTGFGADRPVPEPSTLALIGLALFSLLALARRRVGA